MPVCEKCGKDYHFKTVAYLKGRNLCRDCAKRCLECGAELPRIRWLGWDVYTKSPYNSESVVGCGLCDSCFKKKMAKLK